MKLSTFFANPVLISASTITPQIEVSPSDGFFFQNLFLRIYLKDILYSFQLQNYNLHTFQHQFDMQFHY